MTEQIINEVILEGAEEVKRKLDELGRAGEKSLGSMKSAEIKVKGLDKVATDMKKLEDAGRNFGSSLRNLGGAITTVAKRAAVFGAALIPIGAGLFGIASSAAAAASELKEAALAAGTTGEKLGALQFAASQAGSSAEKLQAALGLISAASANAKEAGEKSSGAFATLGVALVDSSGSARDATEIFADVAQKISQIPNESDRAAAAAELFGRRLGPGLVELLSQGKAGLAEFTEQAKRLGLIMTEEQQKIGKEFNDAMNKLRLTAAAAKNAFGLELAPAFTEAGNRIADAIGTARGSLDELGKAAANYVTPIIRDLTSALLGETDKIESSFIFGAAKTVESIGTVLNATVIPALQLFHKILGQTAEALNAAFGSEMSGTDIAVWLLIMKLLGGFALISAAIGTVMTAFKLLGLAAAVAFGPWGAVIALVVVAIGALIVLLMQVDWAAFGARAASAWEGIKSVVHNTVQVIRAAWGALITYLMDQTFVGRLVGIWNALPEAWNAMVTSMYAAWDAFVTFILEETWIGRLIGVWNSLPGAWNAVVETIRSAWDKLVTFLMDNTWVGRIVGALKAFPAKWKEMIAELRNGWSKFVSYITNLGWVNSVISALQKIVQWAKDAWDWLKKVFSAKQEAESSGAGKARGGLVRGPGTGTSDSIPARLSAGEWVIRAAAVRKYGSALFAALNSMRFPRKLARGFSAGGLVDALSPLRPAPLRFALGGPVGAAGGPTSTVNLTINGQSFNDLLAPRETAERLIRFAMNEELRSAGRKPGWYR